MAIENIILNIIPTGDTPSIHVAQFDVDRPFNVTLKEGEDDFTPTGYDIELQVRKVDSTIVTVIPLLTTGNVVTFSTTEQMTACSGTNIAELQLTKDSQTFATLHFYLVVQRDVLAGGVTSESDIYNLTEQIAAIVPGVIGDDYYNKEEVDEKIAEIPTFDPTNYYDKSDVDTLLNDKADVSDLPDMSDYYNKTETDALLNNKADKSVVDAIKLLPTVKSASGSIARFNTDIAVNLLECVINIDSNVNGVSNVNVTVCGVNIFKKQSGMQLMPLKSGTVIYGRIFGYSGQFTLYGVKKGFDPSITANWISLVVLSYTDTRAYTFTEDFDYIGISSGAYGDLGSGNVQVSLSNFDTFTSYNATTTTIALGESLTQGGILNVTTGLLERTDHTAKYVGGNNIAALNGINNVFNDCGDISVKYTLTIGKAIS